MGQVTHSCTGKPFDWMIGSTGGGTQNGATSGGKCKHFHPFQRLSRVDGEEVGVSGA